MSPAGLDILRSTAVVVAVVHTLIGVDHYAPLALIARTRRWSFLRTLGVTTLCGVGHVGASVLLGLAGIALGASMTKLSWLDAVRGHAATWLLIGLGVAYTARGLWRSVGHHHHRHHRSAGTTLALLAIFVLGPCELLIPLMTAAAVNGQAAEVASVILLFGACTVLTMLLAVAVSYAGLRVDRVARLEHHGEVVAGLAIVASGIAVRAFGL